MVFVGVILAGLGLSRSAQAMAVAADFPDFNSPACGDITQIRPMTANERALLVKARCFVLKVIGPRAPSQEIVWSNFYHAKSGKSCHGLTRFGYNRETSNVFLFDSFPRSEKGLVGFLQLGSTTLHEFHHYWTNSRDDNTPNDPKNIYDDPALDGMLAAISQRLPGEPACTISGDSSIIKNRAQEIACECGIKFWSSDPL